MKKLFSLFLTSLILFTIIPTVSAENISWQEAYKEIVINSTKNDFMLLDVSNDGIPELFSPGGNGVTSFYFDGNAVTQASDDATIPYEYVKNITALRNKSTNKQEYMGQAITGGKLVTYKMSFLICAPVLEIIAEEDIKTGSGIFKGNNSEFQQCDNIKEEIVTYLEDYEFEHTIKSCITIEDIGLFGRTAVMDKLSERYVFLSGICDDSRLFSFHQKEEIKKAINPGNFLAFNKISVLNENAIFVEYYVNEAEELELVLPYRKCFALISGDFKLLDVYNVERELNIGYLSSLFSPDAEASNFKPDYNKTVSFRGLDDYVTYFSGLLSADSAINRNGQKEIADFMEYAVNKCSRMELKATNNVISIKSADASIVAQNAINGMRQLLSVCHSKNIPQLRTAKTVPEMVCTGIDFSKSFRVEFERGTSEMLGESSGIRIALNDVYSIYINTAELVVLEKEIDTFAIECIKNPNDFSVVFTDKENRTIDTISMPVWFTFPAKSDYSFVLTSYNGGTENRGGRFNPTYNTIEFSAVRSGNYQVVDEDITINDIDMVSFSSNEAIRFLVSKGVLEVDSKNKFYPEKDITRYDFTKALVSMVYVVDDSAACSYADVDKKSKYYTYVATGEKLGITMPFEGNNFCGDNAATNVYMVAMCGKILAEKKGYKFPENYTEYLAFSDKDKIDDGLMPYVAVAVQCGLIENSGMFSPDNPMSREQCAKILYKTFILLYDTSPVTTSFSTVITEADTPELKDLTPIQRIGACILLTGLMISGFVVLYKRRKPSNASEEFSEPLDEEETE